MAILDEVFLEERDRLQRMKSRMQTELELLPQGYLSKKKIHGSDCYYLQRREGSKVVSKYVPLSEVKDLSEKIERRRSLSLSLREIERQLKKIQRVVK